MLNLRKKLLLSTAIIVGMSQFGFIACADPVDEAQVRRAHIGPTGPMSQEQVANLKQASATMQKSARSTSATYEIPNAGKAVAHSHDMQDDLHRLNDLSNNLVKGRGKFLDFTVNEQEKLEQDGWRVKGFTGLSAGQGQFDDLSGVVAYNREMNVITVVYNGADDSGEGSGRKVKSGKLLAEMKKDLYEETFKQLKSVVDKHGSDKDFDDLKKFIKHAKAKDFGKEQLADAQNKVKKLIDAKKIDPETADFIAHQLRTKLDLVRYLDQTGCHLEGDVDRNLAKQYYGTKEGVLGLLKEITSTLSDEQKRTVKIIVSGGNPQASAVGSIALADITANHSKELFGEKFDNQTAGTFYGHLEPSALAGNENYAQWMKKQGGKMLPYEDMTPHVDTKQYLATEAEYLKTAHKIEEAQKHGQKTDQLMDDFVDLGKTLHAQAQGGAQAELMAEQLEKGTVHKISFKEKAKETLEKLKSTFLPKDDREELNVLCLDGGGVRGIGTLKMLVELELQTGKKVYQMFDRIYGTSTGGLMAIMLARGMSASEVLDVYMNNMNRIFYRSWSDTFLNPAGLISAAYNPAGLESVIKEFVGDALLKDVKIPVAVTCVDKTDNTVRLLSSDSKKTQNVKMLEAARATSAAPTYFPAQVVHLEGKKFTAVDGGVAANNPSEEALNDIKNKKLDKQYKINLLSLGTGVEAQVNIHDQAGKLGFGSPGNIPAYFMGTGEKKIEKHVRKAHKRGEVNQYLRVNFKLPFAIDLADTSETAKKNLVQLAHQRTQDDDFQKFMKIMKEQQR